MRKKNLIHVETTALLDCGWIDRYIIGHKSIIFRVALLISYLRSWKDNEVAGFVVISHISTPTGGL